MMSEEICAKLLPVPRTYVSVKLKTVKTPLYEKRPPTAVFFHVIFFCSYICSLPVHFLATTIQVITSFSSFGRSAYDTLFQLFNHQAKINTLVIR